MTNREILRTRMLIAQAADVPPDDIVVLPFPQVSFFELKYEEKTNFVLTFEQFPTFSEIKSTLQRYIEYYNSFDDWD